MDVHRAGHVSTIAEVRKVDGWAREYARESAHRLESET
jgi:hypothetical protein